MNRPWFMTLAVVAAFGSMSLIAPVGWCDEPAQQTKLDNQPMTKGAIKAWLKSRLEQPIAPPDFTNTRITFRMEHPYVPTAGELESLRKRVEGKPDHPDRGLLKTYERRLKRGPDIARVIAWRGTHQYWAVTWQRVSPDDAPPPGFKAPAAWLTARSAQSTWSIDDATGEVITAPYDVDRKVGINPKQYEHSLEGYVLECFQAGSCLLGYNMQRTLGLELQLTDSSHWRARVWSSAAESPVVSVLSGEWVAGEARLLSSALEIAERPWAVHGATERTFSKYRDIPELHMRIPMRYVMTGDDFHPKDRGMVIEIEDFTIIDSAEVERMTHVPNVGESLNLLGSAVGAPTKVTVVKTLDEAAFAGFNGATGDDRFGPASGGPDVGTMAGYFRWIGWITLGLISVGALIVWWRRPRGGAQPHFPLRSSL